MLCCEPIALKYSDGYRAFARLWLPPNPKRAALYLHGIQSHGQWFEGSARRLAEAGVAVLLPDRRGSGRNEQDRGHTPSARRLLRDGCEGLDWLHTRMGADHFHVVGVSWGGKLALALYRQEPARIRGLSLVAPGLFPRVDLPMGQKVRVGLSLLAAPRTRFEIPLNEPELFTATPRWQAFLHNDPLRLRQVTASFLWASRLLDRYVRGLVRRRPGRSVHVFLASEDRIIDNALTKAFIRKLNWPQRNIIEYRSAQHTLEFEPDPKSFFDDLVRSVIPGEGGGGRGMVAIATR
jgi:acylglycerol lipase